jgi:preprotein translocase subunit Sec63
MTLRLTDDDIRKNYEQYGHPDGKQSFSMGVALPRGSVEGGNSKSVLAFYAMVFGLGLPFYIVSQIYIYMHLKNAICILSLLCLGSMVEQFSAAN